MKWLNIISALALLGFSTIIAVLSIPLELGEAHNPGPGFLPFYASIILFSLTSLILLIEIKKVKQKANHISDSPLGNLLKPAILLALIFAFSLVLNVLGYLFTSFLLLFAMLSMTAPNKWFTNAFFSVIVSILSFLLFNRLGVQLPSGIFHL